MVYVPPLHNDEREEINTLRTEQKIVRQPGPIAEAEGK